MYCNFDELLKIVSSFYRISDSDYYSTMSFFNFDNAFSAEKDSKSMMFSYGDEDEKKGKGTMKSSGFLGFPSHVDVNEEAFKGSEPPQKKINLGKSSPAKSPEKDSKDEKESSSFYNPPQAGPSPKATPTKSAAGANKIQIPPSAEGEVSSNLQVGSFLKETIEQLRSEVVLMVPEIRRQEEAGDGILARSARLGADIKVGESALFYILHYIVLSLRGFLFVHMGC